MKRRGPVSKEEKELLDSNLELKTDEELAEMINRNPEWVAKYRAKKERVGTIHDNEIEKLVDALHDEVFWETIKEQFTDIEQQRFTDLWIGLCHQFGDTIVHTDKMQMVDLIRQELLLGRILKTEKDVIEELNQINTQINYLRSLKPDDEDYDIDNLRWLMDSKNQLIAVQGARQKDVKQIEDYKTKLFTQLKTTRDQRITKLQDSKETFFDYIKMLDDEENRQREGRQMELIKLAADKAQNELGNNIQYADGTVDRPRYTVDTALLEEQERNEIDDDE